MILFIAGEEIVEPGAELGDGSLIVAFDSDDAAANFERGTTGAGILQRGGNAAENFDLDRVGDTGHHCLDATALVPTAEVVGVGYLDVQIDRATASVARCPWRCHCCCLRRSCPHL